MRKQHAITLAELLVGMSLFMMLLMGTLTLLISGLNSYGKTTTDVNVDQPASQALRRISETLRPAMSVTLDAATNKLSFKLPQKTLSPSSYTGEKEYIVPLVADATNYYYQVKDGKLYEFPGGRVLLTNIESVDPDPQSSQYNQPVTPFQSTTIGAARCVTLNFITADTFKGVKRYSRLKTTVILENVQ